MRRGTEGLQVRLDASVLEVSARNMKLATVKLRLMGDASKLLGLPPGYQVRATFDVEIGLPPADAKTLELMFNSSQKAIKAAKRMARYRKRADKIVRRMRKIGGIHGGNYGVRDFERDKQSLASLQRKGKLARGANVEKRMHTIRRRIAKYERLRGQFERADKAAKAAGKRMLALLC